MSKDKDKSRPMMQHGDGLQKGLSFVDAYPSNDYISTYSDVQAEVEQKFTPKKGRTMQLAEVYGALNIDHRKLRVADCGTYLEYHVTADQSTLYSANFCKDRLCPMCNWRRSLKIFGQVSKVMDVLEKDYAFIFLTLTVRNCSGEELPTVVQQMYDGWRYLYNKCKSFKTTIVGTFRSLEVTRNRKTKDYHPHLHVVLAVRPDYFSGRNYINQRKWVELWRKACVLDYDPIVDVRRIKGNERGLAGAVAEVSKYAVKDTDYLDGTMEDKKSYVTAYLRALSYRRLCSFTGCFAEVRRQLNLEDDIDNGDLVNVTGDLRQDVSYMIIRYCWRAGVYELV